MNATEQKHVWGIVQRPSLRHRCYHRQAARQKRGPTEDSGSPTSGLAQTPQQRPRETAALAPGADLISQPLIQTGQSPLTVTIAANNMTRVLKNKPFPLKLDCVGCKCRAGFKLGQVSFFKRDCK